jgi:uncharacterized protein (TIGR03437 family)
VDTPSDANPAGQTFTITTLSTATAGFNLTMDAVPAKWFTYTLPPVAFGLPVPIMVRPNPNLAAGIYTGSFTLTFADGSSKVVSLAAVITAGAAAGASAVHRSAAGCTPTKLVPLFTVLGGNFSGPAGWPAPIEVLVVDDCGAALTDGAVLVSFSSGDPTLSLTHVGNGRWTGTWTPRTAVDGVQVSATAQTANAGIFGKVTIAGGVAANPNVPVVNPGGVVGLAGFDAVPAPGALVAILGTSLSDGSYQAAGLPLDTQLGPTQALLNGRTLPLVATTENQIAAVLPYDLAANTKYMLIVRRGNSLSVPEPVAVTDTQPAIFTADSSGQGQGQIYDNLVLADPQNPASAEDTVAIVCAGLGLVDPAVDAGSAPPDGQSVVAIAPVSATIGGLDAPVASAGLAPGMAGVYVVMATVPDGVAPGDQVPVTITAGARSSHPVTMSVQ